MKPPTPAMIRLLREIERQPVTIASAERMPLCATFPAFKQTLAALAKRCLVGILDGERMPCSRARWHITDEGRRVLAEQEAAP